MQAKRSKKLILIYWVIIYTIWYDNNLCEDVYNITLKRYIRILTGQDFSGSPGVAAGWGHTYEGLQGNKDLNKVILPIMSKAECDTSGFGKYGVTDNMFCAGYMEGGKDTCQVS